MFINAIFQAIILGIVGVAFLVGIIIFKANEDTENDFEFFNKYLKEKGVK